ncbi:MAG: chorismate mutase [Pseudomonadota bacterium]|uniref:chorismate mutase n=1 Tax=Actibacterium naphthalenivorans TaxID=1614693 RepID=A0A840C4C0_9RHOB|nr:MULTISPECIES: chorismate mutase [Actibacterium]MBB4020594.1 isochorismate pyruvate lyase [Actibacterium naphthalenivorans]MDY6859573.1 chorismate mutase [Pseudomonadota bacterium]
MLELRAQIDALDQRLIEMLARRAAYIDRAAELKPAEGLAARIDARVEQVVANARRNADAAGLDPDFAETIWRQMIDWSIAREERVLGPSQHD